MKKWIKYGFLTTLVLALIGGVTLVVCLDGIIKTATEKSVSYATETDAKLESASLSLVSGHLKLQNFNIPNPKGFDASTSFFKFATSEVEVKPGSLISDQIEVPLVNLDGFEVAYNKPSEGKANYEVIMDSVSRLLPKKDANGTPVEAPKEKSPSDKKIHVGLIKFTHAKVHASLSIAGVPVKADVALPDFQISDLKVEGGMPALTAALVKGVCDQLVKQAPQIAQDAAKNASIGGMNAQDIKDKVKGAEDLFKSFKK